MISEDNKAQKLHLEQQEARTKKQQEREERNLFEKRKLEILRE